ncbi:hypothetical protein RchiOBHm_Chr6g0281381 [Rosa chinensis]|uniref:Uncharacterized protein n=1 Tax=Rosa chinensis TaxID=74649 RepID=A0A2P6PTM1_ROSCH|nr:hypothetical protein RchiOBHm_Chr6g0281381 [Rosa chinensis]
MCTSVSSLAAQQDYKRCNERLDPVEVGGGIPFIGEGSHLLYMVFDVRQAKITILV